jgi:hypothetical protein
MIRANITPIIGRGAPAAIARATAQNRMTRDWVSWRGLKRAIYDEPVLFTILCFRKRRRGFSAGCDSLALLSAGLSESVIGSALVKEVWQTEQLEERTRRASGKHQKELSQVITNAAT